MARKKEFEILSSDHKELFIWKEVVIDLNSSRKKPFTRFKVEPSLHNPFSKGPRRPSLTEYASTITEARNLRKQLLQQLEAKIRGSERLTLSTFLERVYFEEVKRSKGHDTAYNELCALKSKILEYFGDRYLDEITLEIVEHFLERVLTQHSTTRNNYRKYLKSLFKSAKMHGYISSNPVDKVARIKEDPSERGLRYLSPAQLSRLIVFAIENNHPFMYHWALAAFTGMRVNEQKGLIWREINWDTNLIYVCRRFHRSSGFMPGTKTGKSRYVPLPPDLRNLLLELKEKTDPSDDDFVLPQLRAWKNDDHRKPLYTILEILGLPRIQYREFRHCFAVALLEEKTPLHRVSEILGHKDISMTANYVKELGIGLQGSSDCLTFISDGLNNAAQAEREDDDSEAQ